MWSGFGTGVVNQNAVAAITTEEAHSLRRQLYVISTVQVEVV